MTLDPDSSLCASAIKTSGWRQGSILSNGLVQQLEANGLLPPSGKDPRIVIVVSHDCDVTSCSLDAEPTVELLLAREFPPGPRDGNLSLGKNPRRIQFEISVDGEGVLVEAFAHDRRHVDRRLLIREEPDRDRRCESPEVGVVAVWLSRRYVRGAFPDEFNRRIGRAVDPIKKALKRDGHAISALYLSLDHWGELPLSGEYTITLVATMRSSDHGSIDVRRVAQKAVDEAENQLQRCQGVEVAESLLVSEANVSLDDVRRMRRFDVFDYLSSDDDDGDLAPRP